jgi:hypothetical protein
MPLPAVRGPYDGNLPAGLASRREEVAVGKELNIKSVYT